MSKTERRLTVSAWTALYICCVVIPRVCAVSLSSFYPSDSTIDTVLPPNDDGYSDAIPLSPDFPFFGKDKSTAYVSKHLKSAYLPSLAKSATNLLHNC